MNLTERELALIMVALDNTAHTITQSIEDGDGDGYDELQPMEMQLGTSWCSKLQCIARRGTVVNVCG